MFVMSSVISHIQKHRCHSLVTWDLQILITDAENVTMVARTTGGKGWGEVCQQIRARGSGLHSSVTRNDGMHCTSNS